MAVTSLAGVACTETESATNLHTSGPPSIEQVRVLEDPAGAAFPTKVFGFGWFPGVDENIDHHVTSASATGQNLRIIFGKLLLGNYLQQIECKVPVRLDFDGQPTTYDNVPEGATPDDIAKCSESDVVTKTCVGDNLVCICQLDNGCGAIAKGTPVGILDANNDGAADQMRFTPGAVGIHCQGDITGDKIDVPIDLTNSYWNPSGFQQAPIIPSGICGTGPCYDALGPAIVLQPVGVGMPATPMLPTNATCNLVFSPDVVDKSNTNVCAAPNGRPPECDGVNLDQCKLDQACTPGDVSAFNFTVEPLGLTIAEFADGDTGISRTAQVTVQTRNKIPLDPGSIANITVEEVGATGNTIYGAYTVTLAQSNIVKINWTATGGLAANTQYIITFKTTFADFYKQGLPAPIVYHFTTGT